MITAGRGQGDRASWQLGVVKPQLGVVKPTEIQEALSPRLSLIALRERASDLVVREPGLRVGTASACARCCPPSPHVNPDNYWDLKAKAAKTCHTIALEGILP
ncbi:hypothetical protein RI578_42115 (plasmid) [Streptomyces sp. BB1-1-1]|uniref:hypothetical protein n=1 Tax=Streptomyces sp. BB1-1-1 TaxID=3074430 RepID=UPI002877BD0E|nr:hypothetical protein [Streptomyces sp. BB1-1-1]WND32889.1 hypothetical protein RI578_00520 [Streptomyces sp. BB1-1-1]WND40042.1 hypothetical protein RI578_39885 [Streptomyces sp. BB1-1-1]WND40877.1 hypothetical protein RI578_42115 [Streptomyces sp. BB1-1-1]